MIGISILSLTILGTTLGLILGLAGKVFKVESSPILDEIEEMMPGSQCGQCGFPGCRPAAEALVSGGAPVTLCPPGGKALAMALADKLGISADLSGVEDAVPKLAMVREATCIGCTRCSKVCPTDAIVGGPKQIHTVIADACTGCGKCVDICPTECFTLREFTVTLRNWRWPRPATTPALSRTAA